jgi:hypothetical protein
MKLKWTNSNVAMSPIFDGFLLADDETKIGLYEIYFLND